MATPPAIVGDQYVTPYETTLSVARKEFSLKDGNFAITDSDGKPLFELKAKVISLKDKETLYDGTDNPVLSLHKKTFTLHATHLVYAGQTDDELFSVKKAKLTDRSGEVYDVILAGESNSSYTVKGDFVHRNYSIIYQDEFIVAEIGKKHWSLSNLFGGGKHKYGVQVKAGVDVAFVASIVTIIDAIHSEDHGSDSD